MTRLTKLLKEEIINNFKKDKLNDKAKEIQSAIKEDLKKIARRILKDEFAIYENNQSVKDYLKSGKLINVLPDWEVEPLNVYAIWHANAQKLNLISRFRKYLS